MLLPQTGPGVESIAAEKSGFGRQSFCAAHVGPQDLWNQHSAVGLEIVLQKGDQHSGRGHASVVQGVAELVLPLPSL